MRFLIFSSFELMTVKEKGFDFCGHVLDTKKVNYLFLKLGNFLSKTFQNIFSYLHN